MTDSTTLLSDGQRVKMRGYPGVVEVAEKTTNFVCFVSDATGKRFCIPYSLVEEGIKRGAITAPNSLQPPEADND